MSIVDYNTVSSDLFKNISLFHVEDRDESVHYPLKCILSLPVPAQELHLEEHACDPRVKCSWDESKIDSFITKFRELVVGIILSTIEFYLLLMKMLKMLRICYLNFFVQPRFKDK